MKKLLLTLALFFGFSYVCFSQMYVSPSSYVFVNDQFVYVTQNVNLDNNGNFYLRKNSQLLQGTTGAGANVGLGNLSVYQEGTSNNFKYNYWCSPVGVPGAAVGNKNFGITRLNRPTSVTGSTAATILSATALDGLSNPLSIAPRWIYTFTTSSTYAQWGLVGSAASIAPGLGFTMKGVSGTDATVANPVSGSFGDGVANNTGSRQRYDFRGLPNDGSITNAVSVGNFTLIGNPYPSAINLKHFLIGGASDGFPAIVGNTNTTGVAYFWEQAASTHYITDYNGGYGIYTPATNIYTPAAFWNYDSSGNQEVNIADPGTIYQRKFSPIGQGFMVRGAVAGNVTMRNYYRVFVKEGAVNESEFERNSNQERLVDPEYYPEIPNVAGIDYTQIKKGSSPHLKINAVYNNGPTAPTTLALDDRATDGFDFGFDAHSASSTTPMEFYYVIDGESEGFTAIATNFDVDKRIPVGFRTNQQANFKVTVIDAYDFDDSQNVYMHDKETGIYYDIKNGIFDMNLPIGDNKTRFEITFKNYTDVLNDNSNDLESFQVFQNNDNSVLTIFNTLKKDVTSVSLYDVTGKIVVSKLNLGKSDQYEISTSGLSDGIYIVKLSTRDNLSIDKKVSIYRK